MPGVSIGETVDCANPLLQFYYQNRGILTDVAELSFEILNYSKASVFSSGPLNLDLCEDGGVKLGTGRYTAEFDATGYTQGTNYIVWSYVVETGGPTKRWSQEFEVLDETEYPTGLGYRMYANSSELLANSSFLGSTAGSIQTLGLEVAIWIENLTGRYFEPRYLDIKHNSSGSGAMPLQEPIIGIESVSVVSGGVAEALLAIDNDAMVVYNRHLQAAPGGGALQDFDDRDNPRIEFVTDLTPGPDSARYITQGVFPSGRQNIQIKGVFGYTDPNGTPTGMRSLILKRVAGMLMLRRYLDPFGQDISISLPSRIREARTRDQQIKFGGAADGGTGGITGDKTIDDLLMLLMRPPHYGVVGDTYRFPTRLEPY